MQRIAVVEPFSATRGRYGSQEIFSKNNGFFFQTDNLKNILNLKLLKIYRAKKKFFFNVHILIFYPKHYNINLGRIKKLTRIW